MDEEWMVQRKCEFWSHKTVMKCFIKKYEKSDDHLLKKNQVDQINIFTFMKTRFIPNKASNVFIRFFLRYY